MEQVIDPTKDIVDILIQVLIVVIPVILTWIIRTYVRGSKAEKDLAAIVSLADAAIDFVEHQDKLGALNLPPDVSKGVYKLSEAAQWLESELHRAGIKMTPEEAVEWIASGFQKRVGEVRMFGSITEMADRAVNLIRNLHRQNALQAPQEVEQMTYLIDLATDWFLAHLAEETGSELSREEALIWVRSAFVQSLQGEHGEPIAELPVDDPLLSLAQQAVGFVEQLKASGQIKPKPGEDGEQFEVDVALAWALNAAKELEVSASEDQIIDAIKAVMKRQPDDSS